MMEASRIQYLREELDNESIDLEELSEIETAFAKLPDGMLRDERENALASDMLDELETQDVIEREIQKRNQVMVRILAYPSDGGTTLMFGWELDKEQIIRLTEFANSLVEEEEDGV